MKTEIKNNGIKDITVITPDDGKILVRKSDGAEFIGELWLGYTYYLGGEKLEEPLLELPEHYEEIDAPVEEEPESPVEQIEEDTVVKE